MHAMSSNSGKIQMNIQETLQTAGGGEQCTRKTNELMVNKEQSFKRLHLKISTFKAPERTSETLGMRPSFARTEPKMPADQRSTDYAIF